MQRGGQARDRFGSASRQRCREMSGAAAQLQQQLDRLRVPHPAVQTAAVGAALAALRSGAERALPPATVESAARQCLLASEQVAGWGGGGWG